MSDITDALVAAVADACARHSGTDAVAGCAGGGWNGPLWTSLEQIGVTTVSVPEEHGGAGGDVATAVAVLAVLGRYSAALPLAETALLAGWLLAGCGMALPPGPLTAAVAGPGLLRRDGGDWLVRGTVPRVPWARHAGHVAVLDAGRVVLLRRGDFLVTDGVNLAGEPRDDVSADAVVPAAQVGELPAGSRDWAQAFRERAALGRAALMAGAARRAAELSVDYARQREQFGRPIGKFQAVQQHLAAMAGEVLLAKVAVEAAALAVDAGAGGDVAVAAAKTVVGQAAGQVAALAHQVHGAIGFTQEHPLRHSTTRLWAWRDEAGNEEEWSAALGRGALDGGAHGLWPLVTGTR
ncbi:MAG TPA: acyl-CoA dehydrogenase family protein [Trebonia sp.]